VETPRAAGTIDNQGVALVVTLLLLFLMSVLGLAAVLSGGSDLMINGYYANYRASFYAADSGMNIARQTIESQLAGYVPSTFAIPPVPNYTQNATTIQSNINNTYGTSCYLSGPGTANQNCYVANTAAGSSMSESFQITHVSVAPAAGTPTVTATNSNGNATAYQYIYNYTLTSVGSATGSEQATITENGSIIVNVSSVPGTTTTNVAFSAFGAFINSFPPCIGPLVYGTTTGPLYADSTTGCAHGVAHCGSWNFGSGGSYTFTDPVNQTGSDFSYITGGGSCTQSASNSYKSGGTTIAPTFEAGTNLSQQPVPLPANDYNQRWAVLDGKGCGTNEGDTCGSTSSATNPPTAQQMSTTYNLQNANQSNTASQPYSTAASGWATPGSGVYIPYTCSGGNCSLTGTAGGIYVEGSGSGVSTNVNFSTSNASGGASAPSGQVITVTQSSGAGAPSYSSVTASGSESCQSQQTWTGTKYGGSWSTTYTCTRSFTQTETILTTATITQVTVDPNNGTTTVVTSTQTTTNTYNATTTASCGPSATNNCTITAPSGPLSNFTLAAGSPSTAAPVVVSTLNLSGVPENYNNTPPNPSTMVYVDGDVNVGGPASGSGAAIQNNSMVTLTANGNIQQTSNLLYATEPVTTTADQSVCVSPCAPPCCSTSPVDTLIPSVQNMNQVLGLYSINGQFQLNPANSGDNLETDASIAVIGPSGMIATPGNSVGTWTVVGGRVESSINGVSISTGNTYFDRRFTARANFAPPWFPQTSIAMADIVATSATTTTITPQRVQWVSVSGGQ
jgi:hypothetical protein